MWISEIAHKKTADNEIHLYSNNGNSLPCLKKVVVVRISYYNFIIPPPSSSNRISKVRGKNYMWKPNSSMWLNICYWVITKGTFVVCSAFHPVGNSFWPFFQLYEMFTEVGLVPVHHRALRFVGLSEKGRVVTIVLYPEESKIAFNFTLQVNEINLRKE